MSKSEDYKNIPPFMRSSVSAKFLSFNPIYKNIFKQCPSCNKYSLKPNVPTGIITPQLAAACKERKCTLCGYIHSDNFETEKTKTKDEYSW